MTNPVTLILVSLCAAGISFTVTFTGIFKPVREYVGKLHPKVEELFHCPWCFNHYVVFTILLLTPLPYLSVFKNNVMNFFVTAFAMITIGGLVHYVLLRAYVPIMESEVRRKIKESKKQPPS